jgi:hypothetical protein
VCGSSSDLIPFEYLEPLGRLPDQVMFDNIRTIQAAAREAIGKADRALKPRESVTPAPAN